MTGSKKIKMCVEKWCGANARSTSVTGVCWNNHLKIIFSIVKEMNKIIKQEEDESCLPTTTTTE